MDEDIWFEDISVVIHRNSSNILARYILIFNICLFRIPLSSLVLLHNILVAVIQTFLGFFHFYYTPFLHGYALNTRTVDL